MQIINISSGEIIDEEYSDGHNDGKYLSQRKHDEKQDMLTIFLASD